MEPMVALVFVRHTNIVGVDCPTTERIRVKPEAKHFLGDRQMKATVGWDQCPVRLFVRDIGPKLQLVFLNLPLALPFETTTQANSLQIE